MKTETLFDNEILVQRFKRKNHFVTTQYCVLPALGFDLEIVKVIQTSPRFKHLKNRRIIITWGLNVPREEAKQVFCVAKIIDCHNDYYEKLFAVLA